MPRPSRAYPNPAASTANGSFANGFASNVSYDPEGCFNANGYWVVPSWCSLVFAAAQCGWAGSQNVITKLSVFDVTANAVAESSTAQYNSAVIGNTGVGAAFMLPSTPGHQLLWRVYVIGAGPISPWAGDFDFVQFCGMAG